MLTFGISIWKCDLLKGQTNLPDFWTSWKIQRLNPGFLIDFSKTPQLVAKHGGSWSCSYLLVTSKPTNQPPFWGHGISASGITIETSRLPGLGRKTPWLSYQQTGDAYTKKKCHIYLRHLRRLKPFLRCLGLNVVPNFLGAKYCKCRLGIFNFMFLPTSPRQFPSLHK